MRRAKIVCTLGPATTGPERAKDLIMAGMDVARLNMSHGDHAEHLERLTEIRAAAEECGRTIGVFADLQGPKIRLGRFQEGSVTLVPGDPFTITVADIPGTREICSTTHKQLPDDVRPGDPILIDDGKLRLRAESVTDTEVRAVVEVGGVVSNNKGINLPGVAVSVPAMSDKDEQDLRWALRNGVDMIALSFVRNGADADAVREVMDDEGRRVPLIAKIEKPQAVENLDDIIDAFDGFMVARGDLGVELPLDVVPLVQKRIVAAARRWAKPVIVATQMLESMISNPRPTRAEASDVANAILDGADAVMLSGETSIGQYPLDAVGTMARIVDTTESQALDHIDHIEWNPHTTGGVIAKAAAEVAERVGARYLVAFTHSGDTARRLSRLRSRIPVVAFTPDARVRQELSLTWGVRVYVAPVVQNTDDMALQVDQSLLSLGLAEEGERVVIVAGSPVGFAGSTNALRVRKIGGRA
ncbi:MAG: pyruvate kinase [Propionibacterium sp.]|nr:pyruvate kinase [Propionibacterium sp.]